MNDSLVLRRVRAFLRGTLALGLLGTGTDLLLIGHDEDWQMLVPLVVIGISLGALVWTSVSDGRVAQRAFQAAMLALLASGAAGAALHFQGNMEFQLEIDPSLSGPDLALKVLQAKSPPTLAPGTMAVFGLIGLVSTYRRNS